MKKIREKFKCVKCGCRISHVQNMKTGKDNPFDFKREIWPRVRKCDNCGYEFDTIEMMMSDFLHFKNLLTK